MTENEIEACVESQVSGVEMNRRVSVLEVNTRGLRHTSSIFFHTFPDAGYNF